MRALVCGGRDYTNYEHICEVLSSFEDSKGNKITFLIHGGARGVDTLAGKWALATRIPFKVFHANWQQYGKSAGHIRNAKMLKEGQPDVVIAFPGGNGTANMMMQTVAAKIQLVRIK